MPKPTKIPRNTVPAPNKAIVGDEITWNGNEYKFSGKVVMIKPWNCIEVRLKD